MRDRKSWFGQKCLKRIFLVLPCLGLGIYSFVQYAFSPAQFLFSNEFHKVPCSLPQTNPFDPSIKQFFSKPAPLICDADFPVVYVIQNNVLTVNKTAMKYKGIQDVTDIVCDVRNVIRNTDDHNVEFGDAVTIVRFPANLTSDFNHVVCRTKAKGVIFNSVVYGITPKRPEKKPDKEQLETDTQYSVLMFGMDSISRSASIRQLPKMRQYLKELGAYDFKGYMKVGDNTIPNVIPLLTGLKFNSTVYPAKYKFDGYPMIWKAFSVQNYSTFYAEDIAHLNSFNLGSGSGFNKQPTDHYMRPFWLGLNKLFPENYELSEVKRFLGHKGIKVKNVLCNQNVPNHVVLINYLRQFFQHYKGQKKFSLSFLTELSHTFYNFVSYADEPLVEFFKWLKQEGFLTSTILIFFSDHGLRYNTIRNTFVGRIESRMPVLSIVIPEKLKEKYPNVHKSLQTNMDRLVTVYDIHQTLTDIVNGSYDKPSTQTVGGRVRGVSLFQPIDPERSCYDAWIPEEFCACFKSTPVDVDNNPDVFRIGATIVDHINELLSNEPQCKRLTLSKIVFADQLSLGLKHVGTVHRSRFSVDRFFNPEKGAEKYTVSVETVPGEAVFEATCELTSSRDIKVIGSVDRTNKYGNQSFCVQFKFLKPYCYC